MSYSQCTIIKDSYDGVGYARLLRPDGTTAPLDIPYTLEGEEVEAFILKCKKKKKRHGILKNVLKASPLRIRAKCPHFQECGGCSLQHISYEEQLHKKEEYITSLFSFSSAPLLPIIPSPDAWGYRNKMEFSFSQNKEGRKFLGLILGGTRGHVFDVEECPIADPWFSNTLKSIRAWWQESALSAYKFSSDSGTLRSVTLRKSFSSDDRLVILTVSGRPDFAPRKEDLDQFVACIKKTTPQAGIILRIHQILKGFPTQFYEMTLSPPDYIRETIEIQKTPLEFRLSPSAFFQPNPKAAEILYNKVLELSEISPSDIVYDLYCGVGVIGMCLAKFAKGIIGIELSKDACYDAACNLERLKISNFTLLNGDVGKILEENKNLPSPDLVIVDPPRSGLDQKAIGILLALKPKRIVYISCNPARQAENIKLLEGYKVTSICPVDQFPQTPHIENIVVCDF
jgi:23S rRNA (uracil1939-C5)-methyltransferase